MTVKKKLKLALKNLLVRFRIGKYIITQRREFVNRRFEEKYGAIAVVNVNIQGKQLTFSTEELFAKRWFFPRYANGEIHEQPVIQLLLAHLNDANCFVDIGGHFGYYTCVAGRFMPEGLIYTFEMDDKNYQTLQKNLRLNNCDHVHLHKVAVSDHSTTEHYIESNRPSAGYSLFISNDITEHTFEKLKEVDAVALDDFFLNKDVLPDIVKIDVEGAEIKVLKGMRGLLQHASPRLFLEIHPQALPSFHSSSEEVFQLLSEQGYTIKMIANMRDQQHEPDMVPVTSPEQLVKNTMLFAHRSPG